MLRSLFKPDWQKSPAHLLLLSQFLSPREEYRQGELGGHTWVEWAKALGESPDLALQRFKSGEGLCRASLEEHLDHKYTLPDLQRMLKLCGLPVSDSKEDLIARLIRVDRKWMNETVSGLSLYRCSGYGQALVESYLTGVKVRRDRAEQQVLQALRERSYGAAAQLVATFEAEQVFRRETGVHWKRYDPGPDAAMLRLIFSCAPKVLTALTEEQRDQVRLTAGTRYLWGHGEGHDPLPGGLRTVTSLPGQALADALLSNARFHHELSACKQAQGRRRGVLIAVAIHTCDDASVCKVCRELASRAYHPDDVPELPFEGCLSKLGCRCWISWSPT